MGRIRVLSDAIANQIAAGEVVERPASVVKELLENSLDAGATEIRVDVESGGRKLIRVRDNGSGMLRDDALLAFERHATSKISSISDLQAIATLGFRGEALPSIASVSRLTLETRSPHETTGTRVEIAGSKLLKCEEAALAGGTIITVRDLFFNVPARKKFLRTESTELSHIASLVTHYSLAHPDKRFELWSGNSELLQATPVAERRDRVFQVFGGQVMEDLIDLGVHESDLVLVPPHPDEEAAPEEPKHFRMQGFVSQPQVQKLNRNSIYLFVNGRLIRDRLLLHALSAAYHNLMPPACFPFALLFLECDPEEVDVNVHPAKTEVRFRHGPFVHDFVRDSIRQTLMESKPVPTFPSPAPPPMPQPAATLPYSEFSQRMADAPSVPGDLAFMDPATEQPMVNEGQAFEASRSFGDLGISEADLPAFALPPASPQVRLDPGEAAPVTGPLRLPVPDTHGPLPHGVEWEAAQNLSALGDLRVLGQLHESFIIAAGRDGLWIIDQHVAHERILFEQVLRQRAKGAVEVQQLLMPLIIELSPEQQLQYARIADELRTMGFSSEPFGVRTIAIQTSPAGIGTADVERVVREVLEIAEKEMRRVSVEDLRRGVAATIACRAAIKINTKLEPLKMQWLLTALAQTEYPMACPHGRPIALRYAMREILRGFHRI